MRVLHLAESVRGGVGAYLDEVVPRQARTPGMEVRVVVPAQHRAMLGGVDEGALRVFHRPGRGAAGLGRFAAVGLAEVRRFRPQVAHLHSSFAGALFRPLLRVAAPEVAVVFCPHGLATEQAAPPLRRAAYRAAERALLPLCDRAQAVSRHEAQALTALGAPAEQVALVANGLPDRPPPPRAAAREGPLRVLFVGRYDRQKGYDLARRVAALLPDAVALRTVGAPVEGRAGPAVAACANVVDLGWLPREAVFAEIDACDLLLVPSRWEAFGLAALEAMRAAKPVFAAAVGALPELVAEGRTGRLFPPEDVAACAALLRGATRPDLAAMGRAGRQAFVERFRIEHTLAGLEALYAEALAAAAARRRRG